MSLGMSFGIILFKDNGMILGMIFGMAIGIVIGASKDKLFKEAGKVLPNTQQ